MSQVESLRERSKMGPFVFWRKEIMPQLTRLTLLVLTNHGHMKRNGKFGCRYCHPIFNFGVQGVKFATFAQIT